MKVKTLQIMIIISNFMVTIKIILDKRRKKIDLTFPIIFRVTESENVCNFYSDVSINEELWDIENRLISRLHPNSQSLNLKLSKRFYELQKLVLGLEGDSEFSFENLKIDLKINLYQLKIKAFINFQLN